MTLESMFYVLLRNAMIVKPTYQYRQIDRVLTARWVLHQIRQKSCGDPPTEPSSGTRPVAPRQI